VNGSCLEHHIQIGTRWGYERDCANIFLIIYRWYNNARFVLRLRIEKSHHSCRRWEEFQGPRVMQLPLQ